MENFKSQNEFVNLINIFKKKDKANGNRNLLRISSPACD